MGLVCLIIAVAICLSVCAQCCYVLFSLWNCLLHAWAIDTERHEVTQPTPETHRDTGSHTIANFAKENHKCTSWASACPLLPVTLRSPHIPML